MSQRLFVPSPPSLPLAPNNYTPRYADQLNNVLRLYFNQLGGNVTALAGTQGLRFVDAPYGQFSSTADQTTAATTDANAVEFDTTDFAHGVILFSASSIDAEHAGLYNVQVSAQFVNTDAAEQEADVWLRVDGTDIANSNQRVSIAKTHASGDGHAVFARNFLVSLTPGEPMAVMWCATSTNVSLQASAAGTLPDRPATPSVICTVTFVSAVDTA